MLQKTSEFLNNMHIGSFTLGHLFVALLLLLMCRILARIIQKITKRALRKTKLESGVTGFASSAIKVLLWAVTVIIVADFLGVPMTSLVALLSVAGLALSLSVQNQLSNLFSGIIILAVKPFLVGDYIEMGDAAGTVREIGLFATTVSTPDNRLIHIPNSDVTSSNIINYTHEPLRRLDMAFSAGYDFPTDKVKSALLEAARDDRVLEEPAPPFVGLGEYKDSNIEYVLRLWVEAADYWDLRFQINERVYTVFNDRGIEMSYDRLNVRIDD